MRRKAEFLHKDPRLTMDMEGKAAWMHVLEERFKEAGYKADLTESLSEEELYLNEKEKLVAEKNDEHSMMFFPGILFLLRRYIYLILHRRKDQPFCKESC